MDSFNQEKLIIPYGDNNKNEAKLVNKQNCEICCEPNNLISCDICKNSYHIRCLNLKTNPNKYYCSECIQNSINNETKLSESPPHVDCKTISNLNRFNSFEFKQRSSKKDLLAYTNTKKHKRERDYATTSFSNSFFSREALDKELESSLLNKERDKVLIYLFYLNISSVLNFQFLSSSKKKAKEKKSNMSSNY